MFSFFGYIFPVRKLPRDQQEENCRKITAAIGEQLAGFVVEEDRVTRRTLMDFATRNGTLKGTILLIPKPEVILDSRDACECLHNQLLDVANIDALLPMANGGPAAISDFWHNVNRMHDRIYNTKRAIQNPLNKARMEEARQRYEKLVEDALAILQLHKQTSQLSVAYLLCSHDDYRGTSEETLQRRLSRALQKCRRVDEFNHKIEQNKKLLESRRS